MFPVVENRLNHRGEKPYVVEQFRIEGRDEYRLQSPDRQSGYCASVLAPDCTIETVNGFHYIRHEICLHGAIDFEDRFDERLLPRHCIVGVVVILVAVRHHDNHRLHLAFADKHVDVLHDMSFFNP